jgi:hypothetical protein
MADTPTPDERVDETVLAQAQHCCEQALAWANALEDAPAMPGGGALQSIADTAWCALMALHLALEEWIADQEDTP